MKSIQEMKDDKYFSNYVAKHYIFKLQNFAYVIIAPQMITKRCKEFSRIVKITFRADIVKTVINL